jgi:hypothetical protein
MNIYTSMVRRIQHSSRDFFVLVNRGRTADFAWCFKAVIKSIIADGIFIFMRIYLGILCIRHA